MEKEIASERIESVIVVLGMGLILTIMGFLLVGSLFAGMFYLHSLI